MLVASNPEDGAQEKKFSIIVSEKKACEKKALQNLLPIQAGDEPITYAEIDKSIQDLEFQPTTNIEEGIKKFVDWYKKYNS